MKKKKPQEEVSGTASESQAALSDSSKQRLEKPIRGRLAGVDFGTVRIGIAVADAEVGIASPYENYARGSAEADAKRFRRLVEEERIVRFVVGLPIHLDGRESEKSTEARAFGKWLGEVTGVPVEFFDERFTSAEAEQALESAKMTKKRRKARRDMLAAQIMLSAYLDTQGGQGDPPGSIDD